MTCDWRFVKRSCNQVPTARRAVDPTSRPNAARPSRKRKSGFESAPVIRYAAERYGFVSMTLGVGQHGQERQDRGDPDRLEESHHEHDAQDGGSSAPVSPVEHFEQFGENPQHDDASVIHRELPSPAELVRPKCASRKRSDVLRQGRVALATDVAAIGCRIFAQTTAIGR